MNYIWLFDQQRFKIPLKELQQFSEPYYFLFSLLFPKDWTHFSSLMKQVLYDWSVSICLKYYYSQSVPICLCKAIIFLNIIRCSCVFHAMTPLWHAAWFSWESSFIATYSFIYIFNVIYTIVYLTLGIQVVYVTSLVHCFRTVTHHCPNVQWNRNLISACNPIHHRLIHDLLN